jgi:hypothetical protein
MLPVSLREGVNHPITLNKDDLIMEVKLIDDSAFCALEDMKTDSKEYAVMRANVTQEERDSITEYHKHSEPQWGGTGPRVWGYVTLETINSKVMI